MRLKPDSRTEVSDGNIGLFRLWRVIRYRLFRKMLRSDWTKRLRFDGSKRQALIKMYLRKSSQPVDRREDTQALKAFGSNLKPTASRSSTRSDGETRSIQKGAPERSTFARLIVEYFVTAFPFPPVTRRTLPTGVPIQNYSAAPTFGRHLSKRRSTLVNSSMETIPVRAKMRTPTKTLSVWNVAPATVIMKPIPAVAA